VKHLTEAAEKPPMLAPLTSGTLQAPLASVDDVAALRSEQNTVYYKTTKI
jgi:hypothetical protein